MILKLLAPLALLLGAIVGGTAWSGAHVQLKGGLLRRERGLLQSAAGVLFHQRQGVGQAGEGGLLRLRRGMLHSAAGVLLLREDEDGGQLLRRRRRVLRVAARLLRSVTHLAI